MWSINVICGPINVISINVVLLMCGPINVISINVVLLMLYILMWSY